MTLIAPPAPPPLQPITPANNPYDFITQPPTRKKRSWLPSGGSKRQRILVACAGLVILLILAAIVIGILGRSDSGLRADYLSLAQQQTELIRISEIGVTKARSAEAKNLAVTTKLSLMSQQPAILKLAKKAGAKTDAKSLGGGKNTQTDSALTSAAQTNQFDVVFTKTMQTNLKKYQDTIKKIQGQVSAPATKDILAKDNENTDLLIAAAN